MLQYFQNVFSFTISFTDFVVNILAACVCGLVHIAFYRRAYRGPGYSVSFLNSLVMLSIITAIVIMVIGDSLARAFGLIGAMSIIRFRTAIKDTMDIVHVFFALAIGMAAGVGMHAALLGGTLLVGGIMLALAKFNVVPTGRDHYLLQFQYDMHMNGQEPAYSESIERHCKQSKLVNVKTIGENGAVELSYYVNLKRNAAVTELLRELKTLKGVGGVTVFSDDEQF